MAVCANPGRMYMGTARQYMDKQCNCQPCHMDHQQHRNVRTIEQCACEKNNEKNRYSYRTGKSVQPRSLLWHNPVRPGMQRLVADDARLRIHDKSVRRRKVRRIHHPRDQPENRRYFRRDKKAGDRSF